MGKKKEKAAKVSAEARAAAVTEDKVKVSKKRKLPKAATASEAPAPAPAPGAVVKGPPEVVAEEDVNEMPEDAYRAAAVVFFTRDASGSVATVLVAVEERKISAAQFGLDQKGKVTLPVVVFPQGRKEKKDKNDAVETAKREYIEETLDYGGLSKFLDFADFGGAESGEEAEEATTKRASGGDGVISSIWTGSGNLALYFPPAGMTVLFCEVPAAEAYLGGEQPAEKRRKQQETAAELAARPVPSATYHVGKVGHLEPFWIDAAHLRQVADSPDRAPKLLLQGKECRFFPTNASSLRLPEARAWLGLPPIVAK
ncbi:unnamed protein product [Polarella glacialis]|uniref:Uncharacterized protein n=1 Tax=Polarella glacialis TaxID=89957 RepID=A0A813DRP2_POLGL|nr:unnamed protein product [Polarella glacialis]